MRVGAPAPGFPLFHYIPDSQPKAISSPRGRRTMFGDIFAVQRGGAMAPREQRPGMLPHTPRSAEQAPPQRMIRPQVQRCRTPRLRALARQAPQLPRSGLRLETLRPVQGRGRADAEGPRPGPGSCWCDGDSPASASQTGRRREMRPYNFITCLSVRNAPWI